MSNHPYIRYAQALIMIEHELESSEEITSKHISAELEKGLSSFRITPSTSFEEKEKVSYVYLREAKGHPKIGVFLSPSIISSERQAKNIWNEGNDIIQSLKTKKLDKIDIIKMSIAPTAGEFLSFSLSNSIGRGKPKATLKEISLSAISSTTIFKPCLQYRVEKKGGPETANTCIIPDISLENLTDFILLFKKLMLTRSASDLMVGDVRKSKTGVPEPKRPLIFRGNFPNPPRSSALGSIALLGAIGEFAKEEEVSELAKKVLESLKDATMYMVKYGGAKTFTYNHHIIDLAKGGMLRQIVDSMYYAELYNEGYRKSQNTEYQKFDLFASRFLQLFNRPAFKDFLAFRAEYPSTLDLLFNVYFKKIEMIDSKIVASARALGRWLNQVAYFAAKAEVKVGSGNYWEELRKVKAKVLVELESSTFSAKTGDSLIAQAVTRAGRISGMDAPAEAVLFMEKTANGELQLDNAKNLLIAFSRIKNKVEQKELPQTDVSSAIDQDDELDEDLSNE